MAWRGGRFLPCLRRLLLAPSGPPFNPGDRRWWGIHDDDDAARVGFWGRAIMEESSIAHTPTWVVAVVCLAIVSISLAAERFLHYLGKLLKHKQQKALYSALERLKEELMLLGFISFVLSLSEGFIVDICISENAMRLMLPCKKESYRHSEGVKLCRKKDEVPLLSVEALHQLHIFIFILGLVHVVFCATTILLGGAKIRKWKHWETEICKEMEHKLKQVEASPVGIVRNHQGEFISERTKGFWMKLAVVSWIIAFLKQFHGSVNKSDYKALRSAFGLRHFPHHPSFDFYKYMVRALEHDFKRVVGISWYLWLFVILFLLLNINGWHIYFWLAFLPLFLLLVVGAKLEHIITRLAQEAAAVASLSDGSHKTERVPNIKPSKEHFWFGRPEIVLQLIHFILFQNSFEIGFFFWVLVTYGFDSCIMEKKVYAISRLVIGVLIQVICSYVTLPLYAIVTHMDGGIKLQGLGSGLHEYVAEWALGARKKEEQSLVSGGAGATEVEAAGVRNSYEHFRGSPSPRIALAPPHGGLDEIVVEDGGGDNHHRR